MQAPELTSPLSLVGAAFENACADPARLASGHNWQVREAIEAAIARAGGLSAVPALDTTAVEMLRPGSLVRFQGMVQDMWDQEFYLGVYEQRDLATGEITLKTGKYQDAAEPPAGSEILSPPRGMPSDRPGARGRLYARTPLYVVPPPGLSGWAAEARAAQGASALPAPSSQPARAKRAARDEDDDGEHGAAAQGGGLCAPPLGSAAGGRSDGGGMEVDGEGPASASAAKRASAGIEHAAASALDPATAAGFRYAGGGVGNGGIGSSPVLGHGAAAPAAGGAAGQVRPRAVVVKLYDEDESTTAPPPRVSELIEFVGILSLDRDTPEPPLGAGSGNGAGGQLDPTGGLDGWLDDERAHRPPSSAVPRLHCIAWQRVGGRPNPLLPPAADAAARERAAQEARTVAPALRAAAHEALAAALGGDALAAEYVLLWALSAVSARVGPAGGQTAVGCLPLALIAPPPPLASGAEAAAAPPPPPVARALGALCPLVRHLPLTIPLLNGARFSPARDVGSSLLSDCALQLAAHTLLVVDETAMGSGQLSAQGVSNLSALCALATKQTLGYSFGPYELSFEQDTPALLLSRGKPLTPHADLATGAGAGTGGAEVCALPVADAAVGFFAATATAAAEVDAQQQAQQRIAAQAEAAIEAAAAKAPGGVAALRAYLTLAAEQPALLGDAISQSVQEDFVAARQADPSVGADALHRWCTLARLRAQSELAPEVTAAHWAAARGLEAERVARVRAREAQPRGADAAGAAGGVLV